MARSLSFHFKASMWCRETLEVGAHRWSTSGEAPLSSPILLSFCLPWRYSLLVLLASSPPLVVMQPSAVEPLLLLLLSLASHKARLPRSPSSFGLARIRATTEWSAALGVTLGVNVKCWVGVHHGECVGGIVRAPLVWPLALAWCGALHRVAIAVVT